MTGSDPAITPCIGCGYCCMVATCSLGLSRYMQSGRGRCPGLVLDVKEGRYWCRLITEETSEGRKALMTYNLCIGAGCSSNLFNSQRDACREGKLENYLQDHQQQRLRF